MKVMDLRLSQIQASDLRGLPFPNRETKQTVWFTPEFLPKGEQPTILLLDEFNRMPDDVKQAAFQLILDRQVGEYKVPNNVFIIGCCNMGEEDGTMVNDLDTAMKNRFMHIRLVADVEDWIQGYPNVDNRIQRFLSKNNTLLLDMTKIDQPFPTPRSWDMLSKLIQDETDLYYIYESALMTVGENAAIRLQEYIKSNSLPDPVELLYDYSTNKTLKDIFMKLTVEETNVIYSELISSLTNSINAKEKAKLDKWIPNIFVFFSDISEIRPDLSVALIKRICNTFSTLKYADWAHYPEVQHTMTEVIAKGNL
jgi:hypothetical protein